MGCRGLRQMAAREHAKTAAAAAAHAEARAMAAAEAAERGQREDLELADTDTGAGGVRSILPPPTFLPPALL